MKFEEFRNEVAKIRAMPDEPKGWRYTRILEWCVQLNPIQLNAYFAAALIAMNDEDFKHVPYVISLGQKDGSEFDI